MRNLDIIILANAGIMRATGYDLQPKEAYQFYLLKKQIEKAVSSIREAEGEFVKNAGIDNPEAFDERTKELSGKSELSKEERKELDEHRNTLDKLNEMRKALYEDETDIRVKPIPFESWFRLQKENSKENIFGGNAEAILENVFWSAPEEGEGNE